MDAFIASVALPTMARDLHASASQIEAAIAVYFMAYATLQRRFPSPRFDLRRADTKSSGSYNSERSLPAIIRQAGICR